MKKIICVILLCVVALVIVQFKKQGGLLGSHAPAKTYSPEELSNTIMKVVKNEDSKSYYSAWIEEESLLFSVRGDESIYESVTIHIPESCLPIHEDVIGDLKEYRDHVNIQRFDYESGKMLLPAFNLANKAPWVFVQLGKQSCFGSGHLGVSRKFFHEKVHKLKSYQKWIDAIVNVGIPDEMIFQMFFNRGYKFFNLNGRDLESFSSKETKEFMNAHFDQIKDVFENIDVKTLNQYIEFGDKLSSADWTRCEKELLQN